jgi:hypothetical protein
MDEMVSSSSSPDSEGPAVPIIHDFT